MVHEFFNLAFQDSVFPVINRPARLIETIAKIVHRILINSTINSLLNSGIVKTDIGDRFAVFCLLKIIFQQSNIKNIIIK